MAKNKGLGRGLDAIFLDNSVLTPEEEEKSLKTRLPISSIDTNPDQPRKNFDPDALRSLADSISANGLLQPILVRSLGDRYEIIAGERRFRASKLAGLDEIPAMVIEADDMKAAELALIENIQRESLNALEEAEAYSSLMGDYHMTQEEVAERIGRSRSAVANSLRLLDLPDECAKLLVDGSLSAGHCRALLGLEEKSSIAALAEAVAAKNLSVRETEALVRRENRAYAAKIAEENAPEKAAPVKVDYLGALEEKFLASTGRRCKITSTRNKKTFEVEFRDNEDLEEIIKALAGRDALDDLK